VGELLDLEAYRARRTAAGTWPPSAEEMDRFREQCERERKARVAAAGRIDARPAAGRRAPIAPPPVMRPSPPPTAPVPPTTPISTINELMEALDQELDERMRKSQVGKKLQELQAALSGSQDGKQPE
jgi:hypothetical protein